MKNRSVILMLLVFLLLGSTQLMAEDKIEPEDVEMAVVDFEKLSNEIISEEGPILSMPQSHVLEVAQDLGYDVVVNVFRVLFYVEDIQDTVFCFDGNNVTDEVEHLFEDANEVEDVLEHPKVVDITDELIEAFEEKMEDME